MIDNEADSDDRGDRGDGPDEWPARQLEQVPECPVCGSERRREIHRDLRDWFIGCAPGRWTMFECDRCRSAFLDPRPNADSIGRAYARYYTHTGTGDAVVGLMRRVRRAIANDYRNRRFGTQLEPRWPLGHWMVARSRWATGHMDAVMRHLLGPTGSHRLLDVGCGDGTFLQRAGSAGWQALGVEPDERSAAIARSRCLEIYEDRIDALETEIDRVDAITMSHVIEHVHDPVRAMRQCHELLRPGGWIWLETPNLDSYGHERFGSAWRDLDAPRHLCLFTHDSLERLLIATGFRSVEVMPWHPVASAIYVSSDRIQGQTAPDRLGSTKALYMGMRADQAARRHVHRREFITVRAWRQDG